MVAAATSPRRSGGRLCVGSSSPNPCLGHTSARGHVDYYRIQFPSTAQLLAVPINLFSRRFVCVALVRWVATPTAALPGAAGSHSPMIGPLTHAYRVVKDVEI